MLASSSERDVNDDKIEEGEEEEEEAVLLDTEESDPLSNSESLIER